MKINGIGDRIAAARKKKGKTQQEVADITGYSKNTICRLEKSHSAADANQITKIGDALNCDLLWLLTGKEVGDQEDKAGIPVFRTSKIKAPSPSESEAEGRLDFPGMPECDYAVINDSPAMSPRMPEGCLMTIKTGPAEDGQVAAIIDEWGAFQVRWQRRVDGKSVFVTENQHYQPIPEEKAKVIGRVLAAVQVITL